VRSAAASIFDGDDESAFEGDDDDERINKTTTKRFTIGYVTRGLFELNSPQQSTD
jgi:hypothetical protein